MGNISNEMQVELHLHTDASLADGAQSYKEAIDTAIEKGLTSIAITNHGTCADMIDALQYASEKNFHLIVGVEAYIAKSENLYEGIEDKENKEKTTRQHLLLLVKDAVGYQALCRFVADTNRNLDLSGRPVGTLEMLNKHFGPGSEGHSHVICSSACFAGPLANCLLFNDRIDKEIGKIEGRITRSMELLDPGYQAAKEKVTKVEARIDEFLLMIVKREPLAKKKFTEAKKVIKAETDEEIKEQLQERLDIEMVETEDAKKEIAAFKEEIKKLKNSIKDEKKLLTASKSKAATIETNQGIVNILKSRRKTDEEMYNNAKEVAKEYAEIFGSDDFYGEIQYHGWEQEAKVYPQVLALSKELGYGVIATNDVHMARPEDVRRRELSVNVGGISKGMPYMYMEEGDKELYIKTAEEKLKFLVQIVSEDDAINALKTAGEVAKQCTFDLEALKGLGKHYPSFVDADERLKELAESGKTVAYLEDGRSIEISYKRAGIKARYGKDWNDDLQARFDYELKVIADMGFSSYFLYIADVINRCKKLYGTPIGPGRGSGAGSIICYLTGITELEPISLNLLFERFLNSERVSMPDIDTDFSKEARAYAIKYVTEFYGEKKVAGILTKAKMGPKNALTYAPKLYAKSIGKDVKAYSTLGAQLRALIGDAKKLSEIEDVISAKFSDNEDALNIFEDAKKLENLTTSYGQHAAGIISIMEDNVEDFIPLMMAADAEGNEKMVIQADMVAAEALLGFIKFDFLGLKNLNVISACQKYIETRYGKFVDTYELSLDDPKVFELFAKGNTNFVFQFESDGMKKMLKDLKPGCFGDLVLAVSVYRPGPMDFIPDIIKCKSSGEDSEIVKRIPILKECLAETYGFPVYQEQVMKIMTLCAGFSMGKADNVRRYMSKKKEEKLAAVRPEFVTGCKENGIKEEDSNWLFDQLMPFAKYGFNKSHAAAYSYVSYITAYLKLYYPAEYLSSVMIEQGDKTLQFLAECKLAGLEVLPVSVQSSEVNYSVESEGRVRIGLCAIKGLKAEAKKIVDARADGIFKSFEDFIARSGLKANSMEACILSGACDEFVTNREIANRFAAGYSEKFSEVKKAEASLAEAKYAGDAKKISTWVTKLDNAKDELEALKMPKVVDLSMKAKTAYEAKYLGMWMSGSPLEDYNLSDERYKSLEDVSFGDIFTTIGVVTNYRQIKTKNGEDMAFFEILDKDSKNISAVIFPKQFEKCPEIEDNMIIEITGELGERDDEPQIEVTKIKLAESGEELLTIDGSNSDLLVNKIIPMLKDHASDSGFDVNLECVAGFRKVAFKVSKDIENALAEQNINYYVG